MYTRLRVFPRYLTVSQVDDDSGEPIGEILIFQTDLIGNLIQVTGKDDLSFISPRDFVLYDFTSCCCGGWVSGIKETNVPFSSLPKTGLN